MEENGGKRRKKHITRDYLIYNALFIDRGGVVVV